MRHIATHAARHGMPAPMQNRKPKKQNAPESKQGGTVLGGTGCRVLCRAVPVPVYRSPPEQPVIVMHAPITVDGMRAIVAAREAVLMRTGTNPYTVTSYHAYQNHVISF